jgi:hypothetical protein
MLLMKLIWIEIFNSVICPRFIYNFFIMSVVGNLDINLRDYFELASWLI